MKSVVHSEQRGTDTKRRRLSHATMSWLDKHDKVPAPKLDAASRDYYSKLFRVLDKDGSGTLGLDELHAALLDVGLRLSADDFEALARFLKLSRKKSISFGEFVWILSAKEAGLQSSEEETDEWSELYRIRSEMRDERKRQAVEAETARLNRHRQRGSHAAFTGNLRPDRNRQPVRALAAWAPKEDATAAAQAAEPSPLLPVGLLIP